MVSIVPVVGAGAGLGAGGGLPHGDGHALAGLGLLIWSALVVSTIDNFLSPRLVGRDTRMSDLLILLSTLGGLLLFGPVGFIVGPVVAALFVTVWHLYGEAFGGQVPGEERNLGET